MTDAGLFFLAVSIFFGLTSGFGSIARALRDVTIRIDVRHIGGQD